jgi:acyl-CoA synthetase (AMP-forming)/AMP-acid ligase II
MLGQIIFDEAIPLQQQAIVTRTRSTTWKQLREEARRITNTHQVLGKRRIGLSFPGTATSYAILAALERLGCDVFLVDARISREEKFRISRQLRLGALLIPPVDGDPSEFTTHELPDEVTWSGLNTITILTSGTTGDPKAVQHTWETLSRPVRKEPVSRAPRWLLMYRPNLYAGLQVMLQCFANRGTLIVPHPDMDSQVTAHFMNDNAVEFISATPSYWRRLFIFADGNLLKKIPLIQITLGGEMVDQPILDKLRQHFPNARLVHIYATTELGRCFSVSDGLAGFPAAYLDTPLPGGTELTLQYGELMVRSSNSMRMYDPLFSQASMTSGWFATGDLAEVRNGRVHFVGRRAEMINVAGSKVYPLEVERVIRTVPGIADVRVFGKASSIAGEVVSCEIVLAAGQDRASLKQQVVRACRAELASYQQPRLIKFVEQIDLSNAGKTLRSRLA